MARGIVRGGLNDLSGNIKSIQHGVVTLPIKSGNTATISISSVDINKSIVIISYGHSSQQDPGLLSYQAKLTNSTTLTLIRGTSDGSLGPYYLCWQVIEFQSIKSLQHGDVSFSGEASPFSVSISAVNPNKVLVFASAYNAPSSGSNPSDSTIFGTSIGNGTTLYLYAKGLGYTRYIHWYVVEFY